MQISWLAQRQFMDLLGEERFRLTIPQFQTLLYLKQAETRCKMSELADATRQSAASLTGVIDRLIEKQLVERSRHERDRRQVIVAVTPQGSTLVAEIQQARRQQLQHALAHLPGHDVDTLLHLLDRVMEGMVTLINVPDEHSIVDQHS